MWIGTRARIYRFVSSIPTLVNGVMHTYRIKLLAKFQSHVHTCIR